MAFFPYFRGTDANERFDLSAETSTIVPFYINGMGGNDYIASTPLNDALYGGLGMDVIVAGAGDDSIYGDSSRLGDGGNDQIQAGSGNDAVFGGAGLDYVNAQDGNDFVSGDDGDDYLVGGLGADTMSGGAGADFLFGNGVVAGGEFPLLAPITVNVNGINGLPIDPAEQFGGNMGQLPIIDDNAVDLLYCGAGNDAAWGFGGNDELYGGTGRDILTGGLGNDLLVGGSGKDQFAFAEFGKQNFDSIVGFHRSDSIGLAVETFKGLGKAGKTLSDTFFHVGKGPATEDDKIIYSMEKAALFYDRDGNGGKYDMKKFAVVEKGTILDASNFDLI